MASQAGADIAIGNVVGSNICNILLILGVSAAARPLAVSRKLVRQDVPLLIGISFLMLALAAMSGMLSDLTANTANLEAAAASGFSTATDLADWLVRELGLPFRDAHHVTGSLVAMAEGKGIDLPDLTLADMQSVHGDITEDVFGVLGVHNSVASRQSYGGTAPDQVRAQIARWKEKLA